MSASNDRGKIILEALIQISRLDDAAEMKRIAVAALIAIGAIRALPEEPKVILQ